MIQGNVSAHASLQTCVLLVFYLQCLPCGGVQSANTLCLANVEVGGLCQGAVPLGKGTGKGDNCFQGTEASPQVTLSGRG